MVQVYREFYIGYVQWSWLFDKKSFLGQDHTRVIYWQEQRRSMRLVSFHCCWPGQYVLPDNAVGSCRMLWPSRVWVEAAPPSRCLHVFILRPYWQVQEGLLLFRRRSLGKWKIPHQRPKNIGLGIFRTDWVPCRKIYWTIAVLNVARLFPTCVSSTHRHSRCNCLCFPLLFQALEESAVDG